MGKRTIGAKARGRARGQALAGLAVGVAGAVVSQAGAGRPVSHRVGEAVAFGVVAGSAAVLACVGDPGSVAERAGGAWTSAVGWVLRTVTGSRLAAHVIAGVGVSGLGWAAGQSSGWRAAFAVVLAVGAAGGLRAAGRLAPGEALAAGLAAAAVAVWVVPASCLWWLAAAGMAVHAVEDCVTLPKGRARKPAGRHVRGRVSAEDKAWSALADAHAADMAKDRKPGPLYRAVSVDCLDGGRGHELCGDRLCRCGCGHPARVKSLMPDPVPVAAGSDAPPF